MYNSKDNQHYLALIGILIIGFSAYWLFDFNRQIQIWITVCLSAAYVLWGVIHHTLKKEFRWSILLEYLLVASLASVVIISLLLRG